MPYPMAAARGRGAPKAAGQTLLTNLVSHWNLNEAGGTRNDSHGSNHFTDPHDVPSTTGKMDYGVQFTSGNEDYLWTFSSSSLAVASGESLTLALWAWADTWSAVNSTLISKWAGNGSNSEYVLYVDSSGSGNFVFRVCKPDNSTTVEVSGDTPNLGEWYFVVAWFDNILNTINVQVNNGSVYSAAYTDEIRTGTAAFHLGNFSVAPANTYWDGRMDSVSLWKRVLTSGERTALYNSGNGLDYPF